MSDKYLYGQLHGSVPGTIEFLPDPEPKSNAGEKARQLSDQICESVDRSTRHIKGIIGALREKLDRLEAVLDHRTTLIINDGLKKHFELAAQTLEFCDNAQQIIEDFHIPNGDDHAEADQ